MFKSVYFTLGMTLDTWHLTPDDNDDDDDDYDNDDDDDDDDDDDGDGNDDDDDDKDGEDDDWFNGMAIMVVLTVSCLLNTT